MSELASAHHFLLYAVLIVATMGTLHWVDSRRARAHARRRRRDRTQQR
jgi:hypothetical protein